MSAAAAAWLDLDMERTPLPAAESPTQEAPGSLCGRGARLNGATYWPHESRSRTVNRMLRQSEQAAVARRKNGGTLFWIRFETGRSKDRNQEGNK